MAQLDFLIRGARVIDGTGNPWVHGDVGVKADRILECTGPGVLPDHAAHDIVDGRNKVLCPGFIDILSHSIRPLMYDGRSLSKLTQGVTTEIMGEGWTPAPAGGENVRPLEGQLLDGSLDEWKDRAAGWQRFGDWLECMEQNGVSPNIGSFLGGGTTRQYGMGMRMGRPNANELELMKKAARQSMEDGAFGLSYSLIYPPNSYTDTDEIVEVCREAASRQGIYITHLRSEADKILEALEEAIEIGQRAALPVQVYHLKASGKPYWEKMPAVIARIEQARAEGLDITADMYPYPASGTGLTTLLPDWLAEGGGLFDKLDDPEIRKRVRRELEDPEGSCHLRVHGAGLENIMPVDFGRPENQIFVGKRLNEIAAMKGLDWLDTLFDLFRSERQRIFTLFFKMSEENIRRQLVLPWVMVASDGFGLDPAWAAPKGPTHPRSYGTFTRILGKYVREERLLTWEEAVRKMTSAVAHRLGLPDRGIIRPGAFADLVIFDPETVADRSTFEASHQLSTGVEQVWINGTRVLRDGAHTGAKPGRFIRSTGASRA